MANDARLLKECLAVGLTGWGPPWWSDGQMTFYPPLDTAGATLRDALLAAHVESDEAYRTTDLGTSVAGIALYKLITPAQWKAYLDLQKFHLDHRVQQALEAGAEENVETPMRLLWKWVQTQDPLDRQEVLDKIAAIKAAHAYPSGQT